LRPEEYLKTDDNETPSP
jgi:calpain, invertebrate